MKMTFAIAHASARFSYKHHQILMQEIWCKYVSQDAREKDPDSRHPPHGMSLFKLRQSVVHDPAHTKGMPTEEDPLSVMKPLTLSAWHDTWEGTYNIHLRTQQLDSKNAHRAPSRSRRT